MRLWTIQPTHVYDLIIKDGYYICDDTKSSMLQKVHFRFAYNWLVDQMKKHIGEPPENISYPVWAYVKKPNLEKEVNTVNPGIKVCIELEIDEKDVLITDHYWWSLTALNSFPYIQTDSEEEFDKRYDEFEKLPWDEQEKVMLKSWENLILSASNSCQNLTQATFWKLEKSQIKNVVFFEEKGEWIFDDE